MEAFAGLKNVNGLTRFCCVIGDPVWHSLSPTMQNAAFEHTRLNIRYVPFRVSSSKLADALQGVRALGFVGANIMSPHKEAAAKLADRLDAEAKKIGAVNTIVNDTTLVGYNTDGEGALKALREAKFPVTAATVTLVGAGGAARAIAYALSKHAKRIRIFNRTTAKARRLARDIRKVGVDASSGGLAGTEIRRSILRSDLLVNATSVAMPFHASVKLIAETWFHDRLAVFDVNYKTESSQLLWLAKRRKLPATDGLGMLLHQGALSFELWTGRRAPVSAMRAALVRAIREVRQ
jgi:shikimate dehydrogenase